MSSLWQAPRYLPHLGSRPAGMFSSLSRDTSLCHLCRTQISQPADLWVGQQGSCGESGTLCRDGVFRVARASLAASPVRLLSAGSVADVTEELNF